MKMSKKDKVAAFDATYSERELWREVAHTLMDDVPDAVEQIDSSTECSDRSAILDNDEKYEYRLYNVMRGHGGILLRIYRRRGQRVHVDAHYFDDWLRAQEARPYGIGLSTEEKIVAERLAAHRRARFHQETQQH